MKIEQEIKCNNRRHKKRKIPEQTKLLVIHFKPFFKLVLKQMEPNRKKVIHKNLSSILRQKTNLSIFRQCLNFTRFRQIIQNKVSSGQMLKYFLQRRRQYKNQAKILRYFNRMLNAIYTPSVLRQGFWTAKAEIIRQQPQYQNVKIEYDVKIEEQF